MTTLQPLVPETVGRPRAVERMVVGRPTSDGAGVKLTRLTQAQADYLGVAVDGPYKPEHYRY